MYELTWVKCPRDLMKNEELDYISSMLAPELKAAPYLFYVTLLGRVDVDGVFDVEDGVIFARLMRMGKPEDVLHIAELFESRRIITRVCPEYNVFMLTEWEKPKLREDYGKRPLTAEERRAAVAARIERERAGSRPAPKIEPQVNVDFEAHTTFKSSEKELDNSFFCPQNDKNRKSVATTGEEKERIERENRDTHREEETERENRLREETRGEERGLQAYGGAFRPQEETENEIIEPEDTGRNTNLAGEALSQSQDPVNENAQNLKKIENVQMSSDFEAVCRVFNQFFAKNCLGYDAIQSRQNVEILARRVIALKDDKNPAGIIASVLCGQFHKLSEEKGYYQGCPLTPKTMLNPAIYSRICSSASQLLNASGKNAEWQRQIDADRQEAEAQRPLVDNEIRTQCIQYGVDPNSENRMSQLMIAKKLQGVKS